MNFGYTMACHPHWHCHCHCRWSFLRKGEFAQPLIDEQGEEKEEDVAQVFIFIELSTMSTPWTSLSFLENQNQLL